jgi:hypothetical protein
MWGWRDEFVQLGVLSQFSESHIQSGFLPKSSFLPHFLNRIGSAHEQPTYGSGDQHAAQMKGTPYGEDLYAQSNRSPMELLLKHRASRNPHG